MEFNELASDASLAKTVEALTANGFLPVVVDTKEQALAAVRGIIPAGASVHNGASETLREIGYLDVLKAGGHGWNNLHDAILAEKDAGKGAALRRQAVLSDVYVGSAHAVTEAGELVISSNSGSQLPHLAFTSPVIALVVGAQKVTPTLTDALRRIREHVIPREDVRMKGVYGFGTMLTKTLILHKENAAMGRKVHVILVRERLGF